MHELDSHEALVGEIFQTVSDHVPQFNQFLLTEFRQRMFNNMPAVVAQYFQTLLVDNLKGIKLLGWHVLNPIEVLQYKLSHNTKGTQLSINENYLRLVRYDFEGIIHPDQDPTVTTTKLTSVMLWLPFIHPAEEHLAVSGTRYYPIFNIADNCVSRRKSDKKNKSPRMDLLHVPTSIFRLTFKYGEVRSVFQDHTGRARPFGVPKARTHSNISASTVPVPVLLYPLARYGVRHTMDSLGFTDDKIYIVAEPADTDQMVYFPITNLGYMAVDKTYLQTPSYARTVGSLLFLLKHTPPADLHSLYSKNTLLWKGILGDYIHDSVGITDQKLIQVQKHLFTCDRMIGPEEARNLTYDDIHVTDFYSLCYFMINNIDTVLAAGNSRDLFRKRLLYEEQYFKVLIHQINNIVFNYGHRDDYLKDHEFSMKGMFKGWNVGMLTRYLYKMPYLFTTLDELPHSNWLLGPGKKKYRSETIKNPHNPNEQGSHHVDTKSNPSTYAHPSQLVVESILTLSSNPIIAGSINVFAQIQDDGRFVKPDNYDQIEDIFDI